MPVPPSHRGDLSEDLLVRRQRAAAGGGRAKVDALRASGRRTARERIEALLDEDSFVEVDSFVTHRNDEFNLHMHLVEGDGVVCGHGTVDGRQIFCFAQDFSVFGGSMGEMHALKIAKIAEMSERARIPLVGIWDGGGQRAQDGVHSLAGTGELLDRLVACSGRIPMFSLILGPVVGVSALAAGLADFVILGQDHGQLFLSSPLETEETVSGELTPQELGGADLHASRSGIACLIAVDEDDATEIVSELLTFLPDYCMAEPPVFESSDDPERSCDSLEDLIPDDTNHPYDIRKVIGEVVDDGHFMELFETYADNIIVGFSRLEGSTVGIVANQPKVLAGCLDIDASIKAARFIRTCDCYNIPILTIVDVPGFLPGTVQEWGGIIRHGAKLLYAYAEATVPKMTVVTRKAYGGAYLAMSCKHLRSDYNIAWPTGELAVMGAEGAVNIIHRKQLKEADNPAETHKELVSEYKRKFGDPYVAARNGWLDDVIEPIDTRIRLVRALRLLRSKREWTPPKKHGNIPL
ncbi:MAG: acyl-CoA carboxylase subunit beta [Candidatus Thalassarchaeaceae archaeon]|jgi:propionyl-CoA carboxylase beta chain|nr:acyl-CoA carboxylase subunit beta [Candidatus Thalassarchaeaceae archaeon]